MNNLNLIIITEFTLDYLRYFILWQQIKRIKIKKLEEEHKKPLIIEK